MRITEEKKPKTNNLIKSMDRRSNKIQIPQIIDSVSVIRKMSVSIFNPMQLTEFHRLKFSDAKMHHAQRMKPSLDRVRRDLFGPVDREECNR